MRNTFIPELVYNKNIYKIEDEEFHHLKNVCRIKKGESIKGFNGKGFFAILMVKEINKNYLIAEVERYYQQEYNYKIKVGVPLIKSKNFNFILKSIQQLGVKKIYPFKSEYSTGKVKIDKWNKILIESAKQSENFYIPYIENVYDLEFFSKFNCDKIAFYEKSNNFFSSNLNFSNKENEVLFIIGPEGGFSKKEINFLRELNFLDFKLKTNILRSETAVIAMLSILKFIKDEI